MPSRTRSDAALDITAADDDDGAASPTAALRREHSVLPTLLRLLGGANGARLDKRARAKAHGHLLTIVGAGQDTTAYFSSFFALLLAQNAGAQDKVRAEIAQVLGDADPEALGDALDRLPYMRAAMQECLRLYSTITSRARSRCWAARRSRRGQGGRPWAPVFVPIAVLNCDKKEATTRARSDRALPRRRRRRRRRSQRFDVPRRGFLPFGYGVRTCIGYHMAILEATLMYIHLLRVYRIEPVPGHKPTIESGISLTTRGPILVRLVRLGA